MTLSDQQQDEVDLIVAAWQRERPDVDTSAMQVWSRVSRLAQLLDRARADAFAVPGLQVWEFDVLAALRREGEPYRLTPGQLLDQTHVTSGTMTNRIDRLAGRGLVERTDNPDDGRGVIVELTAEGKRRVDVAIVQLAKAERAMLASLGEEEEAWLVGVLRKLVLKQA